ncbi:MAG: putative porin [Bacteroidales bacterium]
MLRSVLLVGVWFSMGFLIPLTVSGEEDPFSVVPWFTETDLFNPYFEGDLYLDTTLSGFQHYDFYSGDPYFFAGKGNVGHVNRSLAFSVNKKKHFSLYPGDLYPGYTFPVSDLKFYRPDFVYSELFYVTGSENEQLFTARHNQRFHEEVYGGMEYQVVNSPGYYSRGQSRNASLLLTLDVTPSDRYHLLGSFVVNRVVNMESGGLQNHLGFEEDEVRDSVFLYDAVSRYRELAFRIHQSYEPGIQQRKDTLQDENFLSFGMLRHSAEYRREAYIYEDEGMPSPAFYPRAAHFNDGLTYDSTLVHVLENRLSWSSHVSGSEKRRFPLNLTVFLAHRLVNITQPDLARQGAEGLFRRERFSQFEPGVEVQSDPGLFLSLDGFVKYTYGGYNDQDLSIMGALNAGRDTDASRLRLEAAYLERQAPYFYSRFNSNYVRWDHDLRTSRTLNLNVKYSWSNLSLSGDYYLLSRPVFLNAAAYPVQRDDVVSVWTARLSARFEPGVFRTRHELLYQFLDERHYEQFPPWVSHHSFYAAFSLFDEALFTHIGFDVRYNAPYEPMAYMPVLRQFYRQYDYESGHVFLVDAFVNAQISRARLFVKFQHLAGLVFDHGPVYDIPFYPLPEAMFKFGVSWMFFD